MRISAEGRLLRLTLDRPERRNALDSATCAALVNAMERAEGDRGVGCILLDAEGPVFCAGMDLEESLLPDAAERNAVHERLFNIGMRLDTPIVAAVHGPALAGGVGLVANSHVAVAAEDATFGLPEIKIGMWPFVIWRAILVAVGERRAVELSLTGRRFSAANALDWGLVHELKPAAEVNARATALAREIAELSPETVRRGLSMVRESRTMFWDGAVRLGGKLRGRQFQSPDYREGVRAFREKRAPRWPSLEER